MVWVSLIALGLGLNSSALAQRNHLSKPTSTSNAAISSVFEAWRSDTWVTRKLSLADLGLTRGFALGADEPQRDIFWPVPADMTLRDAQVHWSSDYDLADAGRTTLVFSIDGVPAMARGMALAQGVVNVTLPVSQIPEPTGFVRLTADWQTILQNDEHLSRCSDRRALGNTLRVDANTTFQYAFDTAQITSLAQAWSALPAQPVIWLTSDKLSPASFETAWRTALTLTKAGRKVNFRTIPHLGDKVDLDRLTVPVALRKVDAFAALVGQGSKSLGQLAEIGAWLVLAQLGTDHADLVILDAMLERQMTSALDALEQAIARQEPKALESFNLWRRERMAAWMATQGADAIRVTVSQGGLTIGVPDRSGDAFARLFDPTWQGLAQGNTLSLRPMSEKVLHKSDAVLLRSLPGANYQATVPNNGLWNTEFQLDATRLQGHFPQSLVFDIQASPSPRGVKPVVSITLNGLLLGAKRLTREGKTERIEVLVPDYALQLGNRVQLEFVRPPESENCLDNLTPSPFSVLPTSHMVLKKAGGWHDFKTLAARFGGGAQVLFPQTYTQDPGVNLPKLVRLSAAAGINPARAQLQPLAAGQLPTLTVPFLAIDVGLQSNPPRSLVKNGRLMIKDETDQPILDLMELTATGVASVETVGHTVGVVYQTIWDVQKHYDMPFRLAEGNFAVIRQAAAVTAFDIQGRIDQALLDNERGSILRHYWGWLLIVGLLLAFVALLYAANRFRNRQNA